MSRRKVWESENVEYRNDALTRLRELFPVGTRVSTVVRHVTASGMGRVISVLAADMSAGGDDVIVRNVSYDVARVVGWRYDDSHRGVYVTGAGMDMAYHVVYTLAHYLHADDENVERARAGYSLTHESM